MIKNVFIFTVLLFLQSISNASDCKDTDLAKLLKNLDKIIKTQSTKIDDKMR